MMYPDTIAPDFSNRDVLPGVDPLIIKRWPQGAVGHSVALSVLVQQQRFANHGLTITA
jgi:hypothetical protein